VLDDQHRHRQQHQRHNTAAEDGEAEVGQRHADVHRIPCQAIHARGDDRGRRFPRHRLGAGPPELAEGGRDEAGRAEQKDATGDDAPREGRRRLQPGKVIASQSQREMPVKIRGGDATTPGVSRREASGVIWLASVSGTLHPPAPGGASGKCRHT